MTSAQVSKGCSNKIQLQSPPPPAPTRTNTAQCSNHCNLRKGMPCALMQVAVIVDIYACINITLHAIAIYILFALIMCALCAPGSLSFGTEGLQSFITSVEEARGDCGAAAAAARKETSVLKVECSKALTSNAYTHHSCLLAHTPYT